MMNTLHPRLATFLTGQHKLLIDGEWSNAIVGRTFATRNPATNEVIANVAEGDALDIDRAVCAARLALASWRSLPPVKREQFLLKLANLIETYSEAFAQLECLDAGKLLRVTRAVDVPNAIDTFRYMAGWATKIEGATIPLSTNCIGGKFLAHTVREPVGVVGQIIPWNFPLALAAWKLAPALAVGCTVVLKPSEQTPLSALFLGELFCEAGFPPGVVNIVSGFGNTAGAALSAHPDIDKIAFTGSTDIGRTIVHAAAANMKRISLELGGKSPNIIFNDADLNLAIPGAAQAIYSNHGQACSAGSRLYIQEDVFDEVLRGVAIIARKMKVGPGIDETNDMGPLISNQHLKRVHAYVKSAELEGATIFSGGQPIEGPGCFFEPTILTKTAPHMRVMREEIFGPVVCATPFKNADEVITFANDTSYGLASGIWTCDISKAYRFASELRAGVAWINCYGIFDPALPFGGHKQSGWGREMGKEVLDLYTELKTVVIRY